MVIGCNERTTSEYPDHSQETKNRVDNIRRDADSQYLAIERKLNDKLTALGFEEKQTMDAAKNERAKVKLERDKTIEPLLATQKEVKAEAESEIERIDKELAANVVNAGETERKKLTADAEKEKADIKQEATKEIADAEMKIKNAKRDAEEEVVEINANEREKLAELARQRSEAERKAREEELQISIDKNKKLTEVAKDGAKRPEEK
jgi:hypothetical protein